MQQIRDLSIPTQWRHIDTKVNPADYESRGLYADELVNKSNWWNGPDFLWFPLDDHQGVIENVATLADNDPEVKKVVALVSNALERDDLEERLQYFSSWHKVKRAVAV